jgi:hypothetical protein
MKLSEDRLDQVIGWAIIVGIAGNLLMCLNLYRQIGDLEYKVYSLDGNINSAIQSLSRDVWEMKVKQ